MPSLIKSIKQRFYLATGKRLVERQEEIKRVPRNFNDLQNFFENNLVEIRFKRRIYPAVGGSGYTRYRHALVTSNFFYAKSLSISIGKPLKRVKNKRPKNWYRTRNLILTYCLTQTNYRVINFDKPNFVIIDYIPFRTENLHTIARFLRLYNLKNVSEGMKTNFHNK